MIDLSGKVALVTGGANGIGAGIAQMLAKAGARVAVNDIDADAAEQAALRLGDGAFAAPGDVSEEAAAAAIVARVVETAGTIDILVNNAGIAQPLVRLTDLTEEVWHRVMNVNTGGALLMSKAAANVMIPRRTGAIINIASIAGLVGFPGSHAYGVSKAAIVMLTKTLATELAGRGIRVNAVAPGVIDAPMLGVMAGDEEQRLATAARAPLGRLGLPEDIGAAVAFLASSAASYITGVTLPVDGGWTAFGALGPASRPAKSSN